MKYSILFFSDLAGVKSKDCSKTEFLSHFSTAEFILEYFQVWTIRFVNWCPQKGRIHQTFITTYILSRTFCLASLKMLKDIYSTKGNMVTRLYSGININCKKGFVKKEQRYAPIRSLSDSSYRPNGQCELTQDNTNLLFFIGFGEFI